MCAATAILPQNVLGFSENLQIPYFLFCCLDNF
jgi:hypothetical protein